MYVTVKGTWMAACGKGTADTRMVVTKVLGYLPCGDAMYEVEHNSRSWVVWSCRCVGEGHERTHA